jgi:hypothetical protein
VSDFAPVRSILAAEREQGQPFAKAWKVALETFEDNQAQDVLLGTRAAWESAYHGKPLVGFHDHEISRDSNDPGSTTGSP